MSKSRNRPFKACRKTGIDLSRPVEKLTEKERNMILFGTGNFEGVAKNLERRFRETESEWSREEIKKYMKETICQTCQGARLKKESLAITINKLNISEITEFSITEMVGWVNSLSLSLREKEIANLILKEIIGRLKFLTDVGLEYLTLGRQAGSLSGGEAQRIRLASQIGSGLTGVLYVLDEPTIGLHPRDDQRLIDTLKKLRDLGNTVIVVEHDATMIREADYVVDFGPGAGKQGGNVVAVGTPQEIIKNPKSLTGQYLSGKKVIAIPITNYQLPITNKLSIFGCSQYNLKNINVEFPLGKLVAITGVSGSGKSTLLVETLFPALQKELNPLYRGEAGIYKKIEGLENIDKAILIDQSPIGRTPRSNPATYTKVFDLIRDVFTETREARTQGFKKGRFSFNVRGGRCETCEGQGQIRIEMQFMSDIWITCEVCKAKRYNAQTLEVTFRGKNIAEVLDMTVDEAKEFFHAHFQIQAKLGTLSWVGLGYMQLGQPATTLSGGEAQRVKLATELSKKSTGKTVYILDEPTTGLHFADVEKLLKVLRLLVEKSNSVFIIEHNLDVIKNSDYIIDLGSISNQYTEVATVVHLRGVLVLTCLGGNSDFDFIDFIVPTQDLLTTRVCETEAWHRATLPRRS
ncbi:MAG: UvrABC system protein A [Candidatus Woesebacteria bacterium GW2011_GWB1_41_10]|uniref:UvrABC system protein A n=1 Tax=Candidatus Woesebacteria bacterium GW2011_GWB1_41_10 TaxID=1618577 RepID=A0A0G0U4X2_9BACT|nr:MAG: UvrABC system protein A [Candidatus Woesebacteria bacterium GW2011_GWB1_41_10]